METPAAAPIAAGNYEIPRIDWRSNMIGTLITALKAGEELKDPAKWKNRVENINYLGALIAGIVAIIRWKYPYLLPEDENLVRLLVDNTAEGIGTLLVAINLYMNRATTKKSF